MASRTNCRSDLSCRLMKAFYRSLKTGFLRKLRRRYEQRSPSPYPLPRRGSPPWAGSCLDQTLVSIKRDSTRGRPSFPRTSVLSVLASEFFDFLDSVRSVALVDGHHF